MTIDRMENSDSHGFRRSTIASTIVAVVVIWLIAGLVMRISLIQFGWNSQDLGQFGDFFGFANSLMSSLALVAVAIALLLQKQELKLQRRDLNLALVEYKQMRQAQKIEAKASTMMAESQLLLELTRRASENIETCSESFRKLGRSRDRDSFIEDYKRFLSDNSWQHAPPHDRYYTSIVWSEMFVEDVRRLHDENIISNVVIQALLDRTFAFAMIFLVEPIQASANPQYDGRIYSFLRNIYKREDFEDLLSMQSERVMTPVRDFE